MSFICKNTDCSAPENKKGKVYPSAMECPFCDAPLVEVLSFNEADLKLINALPYVIAYPLKRAIAEKHAWTKINLLKDTFLNYLKYFGLITASEFFNSSLKDKKMVALFQQALAEPSFGSWNQYIRETLNYLKENNHHFFCPDLLAYYELVETSKKRKLFKGEIEFIDGNGDVQLKKQEATAIGMLINFRNRYLGHGLTLDEAAAKKLWDEYYPIFSLLLEQLNFAHIYPMFKYEHGETYRLQSAELITIEKGAQASAKVWMENPEGKSMDILPFFVVPGELSIGKADKEQILAYESYTGKTIKFFSPEGTEKQTSGKILEKLNLLLRDKQKELPNTPDSFTKEVFINRIADENKLILDTLTAEKKYIPNVYVHREEMEIKLREWIGARANIFFIAAEAGSGKTNLLIEIQKQYAAQNLSVLFIRAARMEKSSLKAQIAYLLNIQPELGIEHYSSIAGTQANPTFIFIDGLNEATQAEILWQEIIDISKKSIPGSLKFVVSSRANTSADLDGYKLNESDEVYLYGEKKEGHTGLSAHAFWLTALNMAEMKSAWEAYGQTNKNKYKPKFSFDDLATFDRSIYNLISNPLVLRIFLETYHNKSLPKKGNKHLNIWQDWLATFSEKEIAFLKLLAKAVWDKGENELLLDDLLNNHNLKPFLTSDLINAPYPRLKNLGWISRYAKDFNACLSFTIEGSLLYLLGFQLNEQQLSKDFDAIISLLKNGSKIQQSAVESYLSFLALNDDLSLVCELIDAGQEYLNSCDLPMLLYLRNNGVKFFIEKIFSEPTDNAWQAMLLLSNTLHELQELKLRDKLLRELMLLNTFSTVTELELCLKACLIMNKSESSKYLSKIEVIFKSQNIIEKDSNILCELGHIELQNGNNERAINYYHKSIDIDLKESEEEINIGITYFFIGSAYAQECQYHTAIEYFDKALSIYKNCINPEHSFIGDLYNEKGLLLASLGEYDKALELLEMSHFIALKNYGAKHPSTAVSYNNFGLIWHYKGEFNKVLLCYEQCLLINISIYGEHHIIISDSYLNIGNQWQLLGDYEKALVNYNKCLDIRLNKLGNNHPKIADLYGRLGNMYDNQSDNIALEYYKKALNIYLKALNKNHDSLARLYNSLGNYHRKIREFDKAIEYCEKSCAIYINNLGDEHPFVSTILNNIGKIYRDKGDNLNALVFLHKSLDMKLITLGDNHPSLSKSFNAIAILYDNIGELDEALKFYEKSMNIELNSLGEGHVDLATSYKNIGHVWERKGAYQKAIEFYQNSLNIELNYMESEHLNTSSSFLALGECHQNLLKFDLAIQIFKEGFIINKKGGYPFRIASCYEKINNLHEAFLYFLQSAEIRNGDPEAGPEHESTKESIQNTIRVAKLIDKENELPEWIKKHNK